MVLPRFFYVQQLDDCFIGLINRDTVFTKYPVSQHDSRMLPAGIHSLSKDHNTTMNTLIMDRNMNIAL